MSANFEHNFTNAEKCENCDYEDKAVINSFRHRFCCIENVNIWNKVQHQRNSAINRSLAPMVDNYGKKHFCSADRIWNCYRDYDCKINVCIYTIFGESLINCESLQNIPGNNYYDPPALS